jgi:hypothetical protein
LFWRALRNALRVRRRNDCMCWARPWPHISSHAAADRKLEVVAWLLDAGIVLGGVLATPDAAHQITNAGAVITYITIGLPLDSHDFRALAQI